MIGMELRTLRYFAAVVEAGSLTAAAGQLHLSQPSLSAAIAKLELGLGVQLLMRSPRGVEPTAAGRYLLDASARLLADADTIVHTLARHGSGVEGTVTLAAVPALMWHRVPTLLRHHAELAPNVHVRLSDPPPWSAIDMLHERRVDLAAIIVADHARFMARRESEFEIFDWGEIPLVAALPRDWDAPPEAVGIDYFEGKRLLLPVRTAAVPSLPEAVDDALFSSGVVPGEVRTVETIQAGLPLIEAGLGAAILPDPDGASLARFDVALRRIDPPIAPLRALVLARPGARENPAVARLIGMITPMGQDRV